MDHIGHNGISARAARLALAVCLSGLTFGAIRAQADSPEPQVGRAAPDFAIQDTKGTTRHLSEFHGKPVVLEWTNADCPYTRKHYSSGNMQSVQKLAQKDLAGINASLKKKKLEAITVPAEADWQKKKAESAVASGAGMRADENQIREKD